MITHQKYLIVLIFFILVSLSTVALISYTIDPARIYHIQTEDVNNSSSAYAAQLLKSNKGLMWPNNSWNERDVKRILAQTAPNIECAVIGSSRAMQISSFRQNASLKTSCDSILNLGVSGGTLEDYLAISFQLINNKQKPKTVIFSVDPWAFDFHQDSRWERYKDAYFSMKKLLRPDEMSTGDETEQIGKYLLNLINPAYFLRSVKEIGTRKYKIEQAPIFDYSIGINMPVFLPDGSHIYSSTYLANAQKLIKYHGGGNYKIKLGSQISEDAFNLFETLLIRLNKEGINVVILMVPYHPRVWTSKASVAVTALREVEPRMRDLGKKLSVKILGSYNPDTVRCHADEFYDFIHAKDTCISKINNFVISKEF